MKILTTCIGAYPKPEYISLPDWFNLPAADTSEPTRQWQAAIEAMGEGARSLIDRGVTEIINDQVGAGIDIPTDGELVRENYVHYHCRHLNGFDFERLKEKSLRGGAYVTSLPAITGKVSAKSLFLSDDWKLAQTKTTRPVKITLPGPMTVSDTCFDTFYHDNHKLGVDIAAALNAEVRQLADNGCTHIQIDEPLFARQPEAALEYGFENLERAFHGCPGSVTRTVHMCCGYPDKLDNDSYPKADRNAYSQLADAIEYSSIDAVSVEDAHRHNDLRLLEQFQKTTVILGVVAIAKSEVESVEQIRERLRAALQHINPQRLMAAPDCGLGMLSRELALGKIKNLCIAAGSV